MVGFLRVFLLRFSGFFVFFALLNIDNIGVFWGFVGFLWGLFWGYFIKILVKDGK